MTFRRFTIAGTRKKTESAAFEEGTVIYLVNAALAIGKKFWLVPADMI